MSYRIASFNIQKFSANSVNSNNLKTSTKDLKTIAEIIKDFDIIAIQEIYHKEALKELIRELSGGGIDISADRKSARTTNIYGYRGRHWEGRWATPKSYYSGYSEGYAFVWNTDRIKLVTNKYGEQFEPRIETFSRKKIHLVRPPFIGRFMPVRGRTEIRLINTHIAFGVPSKLRNQDEELYNPDFTDIKFRRNEFRQLIESIYVRFANQKYDITGIDKNAPNLDAYTFLLGDYNLNLKSSKAAGAKLGFENEQIQIINENMNIITVNDKLTTLKKGAEDAEANYVVGKESHMANNYDHFSYDSNKLGRYRPCIDTINAFDKYSKDENSENTKYDIYKEKVSDHIPIFMEFNVRKVTK